VMVLEVKAHRFVQRDEHGRWYLGKDSDGSNESPFTQAKEAMESLRGDVVMKNGILKKVPFFHMVLFTHCEFNQKSLEWEPWEFSGMRRYRIRGIGRIIEESVDKAREKLRNTDSAGWFDSGADIPNKTQVEILTNIVRPAFEIYQSPVDRLEEQQVNIKSYTQEQLQAIDAMVGNSRVLFTGPAGTGKTMLAIESARRFDELGLKTLFLCFNKRLAGWLQKQLSATKNVQVCHFHKFMTQISPDMRKQNEPEFWSNVLPELVLEKLLNDDSEDNQFDALVIDEAQDLMNTRYLDVLELVLTGGLGSGKWHVYGDFAGQAIYSVDQSPEELLTLLKDRSLSMSRYSLTVNCRNRRQTAEHAIQIGQFGDIYSKFRRQETEGSQVRFRGYSSDDDQIQQLSKGLTELLASGYPASQIVILSPKRRQSAASVVKSLGLAPVEPLNQADTDHVGFTTVHDFKGMENSMILITDVDDLKSDYARRLLYTATTRCTDAFQIFLSPTAQVQLRELLTRGNN
jgi:superfamily I DNA and RNA helicase